MATTPHAPLYERVDAFFTAEEFPLERNGSDTIGHGVFRSEHQEFDVYVQTLEEDGIVLVYSIVPFEIPEDKVLPAMEFVTRANHGIPIGCFEMDVDAGMVRYRTSIESDAESLTDTTLQALVGANLAVTERYLPGLRAVAFLGLEPAFVIGELEG